MDYPERLLYHQIHPLKIVTDLSAAGVALYLLWSHSVIPALIVLFVPTTLISMMIIRRVDMGPLKDSALGRYLATYMTRTVELVRSAGLAVMAAGAWYRLPWVIGVGALIIAGAWLSGVFFPNPAE